ncbi:hypothetical protein V8F06_010417 [Rhypophila decipiens]
MLASEIGIPPFGRFIFQIQEKKSSLLSRFGRPQFPRYRFILRSGEGGALILVCLVPPPTLALRLFAWFAFGVLRLPLGLLDWFWELAFFSRSVQDSLEREEHISTGTGQVRFCSTNNSRRPDLPLFGGRHPYTRRWKLESAALSKKKQPIYQQPQVGLVGFGGLHGFYDIPVSLGSMPPAWRGLNGRLSATSYFGSIASCVLCDLIIGEVMYMMPWHDTQPCTRFLTS